MKEIKLVQFMVCCLALLMGLVAHAQTPVKVNKAELSISFGVAKGKLVTVGDTMVFIDEDNADASFAIDKANIKNWNEQDGVVTIDTNTAIKDRSGEKTHLAFRLVDGTSTALTAWAKNAGAAMSTASTGNNNASAKTTTVTSASTSADSAGTKVYQARQKRFPVGTTDGKLVLSETEIAFESLNDIKRSQRWSYKDIKEIKQPSAYLIEITPFRGDKYKLELQGESMSSSQFKALEDRIAAARVAK